ncbi:hypothetical protein J6590_100103 [Homalodisca vitripennis]|nr:hypothetical protein J6590_100103 [Homalodisca vitripennis]
MGLPALFSLLLSKQHQRERGEERRCGGRRKEGVDREIYICSIILQYSHPSET